MANEFKNLVAGMGLSNNAIDTLDAIGWFTERRFELDIRAVMNGMTEDTFMGIVLDGTEPDSLEADGWAEYVRAVVTEAGYRKSSLPGSGLL